MSLLSENIFINGSFDIWLNGTEFTDISSATEVAGKWSVSTTSGALGYARRSDVVPVESVCEYSLELETGAADMAVDLRQRIDARYAAQIQRVVTFSAVIYNGAETAITPDLFLMVEDEEEGEKQIIQLTKASLQACAPGAWTKVVHTFDLGQEYDLQAGGEFKLRFAPFETGALVRVTELKLESGGAATPFTRRFYEQELSLIKGESYLDTSLFVPHASTRTTACSKRTRRARPCLWQWVKTPWRPTWAAALWLRKFANCLPMPRPTTNAMSCGAAPAPTITRCCRRQR